VILLDLMMPILNGFDVSVRFGRGRMEVHPRGHRSSANRGYNADDLTAR